MTEHHAKITAEDGYKIYVMGQLREFKKGDLVSGEIAKKALEDKAASRLMKSKGAAPENKASKAPETKAKPKRKTKAKTRPATYE